MPLDKLRYKFTLSLITILLIWPLIHIGLSSFTGLNSWKLSGWGMYASTHPRDISINVFLIKGDASLSELEIGPIVQTNRVVLFQDGQTEDLDRKILIRNSKLIQYLQVFPTNSGVEVLVKQIKQKLPNSIKPDYVLVMRTESRINLTHEYAYTNTTIYVVQSDEAKNLGHFSTSTMEPYEIFDQVEMKIAQRNR